MYPQNFEEACTSTGENPNDEKFTSGTADEVSYKKLKVVTKAINKVDNDGKDWETNWDDSDEEKWYGWWDMEIDKNNPSGFRFLAAGYVFSRVRTRLLGFATNRRTGYAIRQKNSFLNGKLL